MQKKLTITVDEQVYNDLYRVVGRRRISQFIEGLVRPHVTELALEEGYRQMAADEAAEAEALEWIEALVGLRDAAWSPAQSDGDADRYGEQAAAHRAN